MFILRIVSRLKEQLQTPQQRRQKQQQRQRDAPDLRRWSDFQNPFPSVSPGGYTRYYEKVGGVANSRTPLSPLAQPDYTLVTPKKPEQSPKKERMSAKSRYSAQPLPPSALLGPIPTSPAAGPPLSTPLSSARRPSANNGRREKFTRPITLSTIHEGSIAKSSSRDHRLSPRSTRQNVAPKESNADTRLRLRRRQWRLLRTPSIIKDFSLESNKGSRRFNFRSLNVEGYVYLSTERSSSSSSLSSSDHPVVVDVSATKAEGRDETIHLGMKSKRGKVRFQESDQRPDSWNTFHSAKSHFSDV